MEAAFERGDISDWVEFFRQGALTPLCHDRFPKLTEELRESLSHGDEAAANLLSVLDKVPRTFQNVDGFSQMNRKGSGNLLDTYQGGLRKRPCYRSVLLCELF